MSADFEVWDAEMAVIQDTELPMCLRVRAAERVGALYKAWEPVNRTIVSKRLDIVAPEGKWKRHKDGHQVQRHHSRTDDSLAAYIAAPIWSFVWYVTFGRWGKRMWGWS